MISFYPFKRPVLGKQAKLSGEFKNLKVALISDDFTSLCLSYECQVRAVSPRNYKWMLKYWRPDILLTESAWCGRNNAWKFKIASYKEHPKRTNDELRRVVSYARELGIPSVFWNKEDAIHFDRFINSASLFDYIFTVDENAIPLYRAALGDDARLATLMFSIQPALHAPSNDTYRYGRACFVGSYSHHIHPRRRMWQDMLFESARDIGLTVYDRNSDRKSEVYRYPVRPWIDIHTKIDHARTAQIYREHMLCLNVNTIEDSATMFSRRFLEILASGGLAVSTPALSIKKLFPELCHIVSSPEEMSTLFDSLRNGWRPSDRDMVRSASEHVLKRHTWEKRLGEILEIVPIGRHC
ncbi:glycosyltransferase [Bordetella sp. BOR01]|uniref:CgeB family protein n=1 Tax=Bordetella sp. BOR01 TaxID=2854779 RepID=UPI001C44A0D0|nr:glycosyltransferase [Bordetella sp. BOR01]MBV7486191.1 glycosyltransferase [Bordetella sp. BOR01]